MKQVLILGAGAIGRGYLPWALRASGYELVFVDSNASLVSRLERRISFRTYRVNSNRLEHYDVPVAAAYLASEYEASMLSSPAAVFVNVGPRNTSSCARMLSGLKCPIILCENDPGTVVALRTAMAQDNVYFAVPDVITSNTAPADLLAEDSLSVVTEDGLLFVDSAARGLQGDIQFVDAGELLDKHWQAKLYLHNTPHCIAAYLGALVNVSYVHEAMAVDAIDRIVRGVMEEMLNSLKLRWEIPHEFLDWYAAKELARFRCTLLCDPVARVAREPLRKLELGGRLIGAVQRCLAQGLVPQNILKGVAAAMLFQSELDSDNHLTFMREALPNQAFVTQILGLRLGEALELVLEERLPGIIDELQELVEATTRT